MSATAAIDLAGEVTVVATMKIKPEDEERALGILGRRQLRFVLAWAELHQDELAENWRRARAGETLQPVEPLR